MDRRSAIVLLVVFGTGVFLAGLELMITAVALPSILADLVDSAGVSAWIELRKASWIVNGYLLVYILTMPLAGRLADLWGARRLFLGALAIFVVGSALAGASQNLDQLIAARLVQAVGGGVLVPVGTAAAAHLYEGDARARALGVIGALTFLGMAAGPFLGAAILGAVHPEDALIGAGPGTHRRRLPDACLALDLLRQRPDRHRGVGPRLGRFRWLGDPRVGPAASTPGRHLVRARARGGLLAITLLGTGEHRRHGPDPGDRVHRAALAPGGGRDRVCRRPGLRIADPFLDVRLFGNLRVQRGGPGLAADRLCVRHRDHRRGGLRRSRPLRRAERPASGARLARRGDRRRRARVRASSSGS